MKLQLFTASSDHKAISMIHAAYGPDALIYKTRSVPNGVEILAGPPLTDEDDTSSITNELPTEKSVYSNGPINQLQQQVKDLNDMLNKLTKKINHQLLEHANPQEDEQTIKRQFIIYYLNKLGFRGHFCQKFATQLLRLRKMHEDVSEEYILHGLLKWIKTSEIEYQETQNVCALIGPTGVGKTLTIAKLVHHYIAKYGTESVGLITTDFKDIAGRNRLLNFSWLFNIDIEFADTKDEMADVLQLMQNKKLVLIDTHGVSQRDTENVAKLLDLLESQKVTIHFYLTMPCNVQEGVLDEIARAFSSPNLAGCILTKQDECINLAPALGICFNYKMPISYICDGQDVSKNIQTADPYKIMQHISAESSSLKARAETKLIALEDRQEKSVKKQRIPPLKKRAKSHVKEQ